MASNWKEDQRAALAVKRGKAASNISDPDKKQKFIAAQGDLEEKHGIGKVPDEEYERLDRQADDVEATKGESMGTEERGAMSAYKHGTSYVPKTGPAVLHKGEAVLPKESADKIRSVLAQSLGGHDSPAKEIDHIRTRKIKDTKSGKTMWHHEHHHTRPDVHPVEHAFSQDQDEMVGHMLDHVGEQNPGEAEADAGQSGIAEAGAQ